MMSKYIVQRLSLGALTILGVLVLVFIIMRVIPGDPVHLVIGFDASHEEIAAVRHRLGIDQPIPIQFVRYVVDVVKGDFGQSIRSGRPVLREIEPAVINTLKLVGCTILLVTILGVAAGVVAARWPNSFVDHLVMIAATFGMCTPSFFLALVLMLLFAIWLQWLPSIGVGGFEHLILPTLTLATASITSTARMTRASLLEVLSADYVRTARA
jgi:peptide/nickel transport system permease protein